MYIIIVGCGRVGAVLADLLSREGNDVVIIDTDEGRFKGLDPRFSGVTILGDGADIDILKEAKIKDAQVFVAATGDDNSNLTSAQIARKIFNVPRVLVRVKDPRKMDVYREYDLEAVSATTLAAHRLAEMAKTPREIQVLVNLGEVRVVQFKLPTRETSIKLAKMVRAGTFSPCAILNEGKVTLENLVEGLLPGAEVVGAVSSGKMKLLGQLSQEK